MKFKLICLLSAITIPCLAQVSFDRVEIRSTFASASEGNTGHLTVDAKQIVFSKKKNGQQPYFSIPTTAVKDLFYSRVSGRRIGAAIIVSPLLLFSKGRKHYMTISFNDGQSMVGAVEFKLDKSNYRPVLRSVETSTGVTMKYDQEGVKETEQVPAKSTAAGKPTQ